MCEGTRDKMKETLKVTSLMLKSVPIFIVVITFGALSQYQSLAQDVNNPTQKSDSTNTDDIEIAGIIIDATQTKIGKDFYDLFYQQWNELENVPKQSITISEKALPQLGSQISIEVEDYVTFLQNVQPRYEVIEQMVSYAMQQTILYIQNYDEMQNQLIGEDLKGTGIY